MRVGDVERGDRGERDQRGAQRVADHHPAAGQALGPGQPDVVGAQHLEHRAALEPGPGSVRGQRQHERGQQQVAGVVAERADEAVRRRDRRLADGGETTRIVSALQPGDLVFWGRPAYHVGIYVGGGKVLDAPHTGTDVQVQAIWGSPSGAVRP